MRAHQYRKGYKVNAWVFLHPAGRKEGRIAWACRCVCGKEKILIASKVLRGKPKSCGCISYCTSHGQHDTATYTAWADMKQRCCNPNNKQYGDYGGRGITVCRRWSKFEHFLADLGHKPPGMSLDRKNNTLGYSPANCRWATRREQENNKRTNVRITFAGATLTIAGWADRLGLNVRTLRGRISNYGWPVARALQEPVHTCGRKS